MLLYTTYFLTIIGITVKYTSLPHYYWPSSVFWRLLQGKALHYSGIHLFSTILTTVYHTSVFVLGQDKGCLVKYSLSPREIPRELLRERLY